MRILYQAICGGGCLYRCRLACWIYAAIAFFQHLQPVWGSAQTVSHSPAYRCCTGLHLRIGVPAMSAEPYIHYDQVTKQYSGYWLQFVELLASDMGFSYTLVGDLNKTLGTGEWYASLTGKVIDVTWISLSDPSSFREAYTSKLTYTAAFMDTYTTGVVLKVKQAMTYWKLFHPLETDVWIGVLVIVFLAAVLVILLDVITPKAEVQGGSQQSLRTALERFAKTLYHMLAIMVAGEDYEWRTWPGRLLRLALLFSALVFTSTYTANLAAFFTAPAYEILGPKDFEDLKQARACVRFTGHCSWFSPFVGSCVENPEPFKMTAEWWQSSFDFCRRKLLAREADVWLDDFLTVKKYTMKHCKDLQLVPSINLMAGSTGFALLKENFALAMNISAAVAHIKVTPTYNALLQESFQVGRETECKSHEQVDATTPVSAESMAGMFIISGTLAVIAILVALLLRVRHILQERSEKKTDSIEKRDSIEEGVERRVERRSNPGLDHTMTEGEMLRLLLQKVDVLRDSQVYDGNTKAGGLEPLGLRSRSSDKSSFVRDFKEQPGPEVPGTECRQAQGPGQAQSEAKGLEEGNGSGDDALKDICL
eukprot:TRINITY_DN41605_c0_g1_i1.p1 TRINITY_DN41605_c0_g1~~TRINITY_DN41605_c0_g1_i1.p1  ORF type:complete len:594 (-),score=93.24 TRINITY_DN41605_c0_g1_i1:118-1899(-)